MTIFAILVFWLVAIYGLFSRGPVLLYLYFFITPFGAFAVIPSELTAGLSLIASSVTAGLIIVRQLFFRRGFGLILRLGTTLRHGLLLTLFLIVALIVSILSPRLFAGSIYVSPMIPTGFMKAELLKPTIQNFSQSAYIMLSVISVFAFSHTFIREFGSETIQKCLFICGFMTVFTGGLDLISSYVPISGLLDVFRNAQYAMLDDASLSDGTKRVVGLMPEASAFGATTMGILALIYFTRDSFKRSQKLKAQFLIFSLALMVILSTSSAAYVGAGVFIAIAFCEMLVNFFKGRYAININKFLIYTIVILFSVAVCMIVFATNTSLTAAISDRINQLIFSKSDSMSYLERSMWTQLSFQAGLDSNLLGVGLGSTRASNFAAALFGSTGILGFILYFSFVFLRLTSPIGKVNSTVTIIVRGFRWAFFPSFSIGLLAGTTPDFGTWEAMRWGVILALTYGQVQSLGASDRRRTVEAIAIA